MVVMAPAFFPLSAPNLFFIAIHLLLLFSLCPSPLQNFFKSVYCRGKLIRSSSSSSPPKFTIPQRLCPHFYLVGSLFNGLLLLLMLFYIFLTPRFVGDFKMSSEEAWRTFLLLFLFELHVLRRFYEDMFVTKFSSSARMQILTYPFAIAYYILVPLTLFPRGAEFLTKSFQGLISYKHGETGIEFQGWKPLLNIGWLHWFSSVLFMWGWFHQYRCHMILASLRSKKGEENSYKIPYGDWFEYVSSAHYFAEWVMYFSFVVAEGGRNLNTLLLFSVVVGNLGFTAVDTHKWYKEKFDDYPASRKAIIPFVY